VAYKKSRGREKDIFGIFKAVLGICETKLFGSDWEMRDDKLLVNIECLDVTNSLGGTAYCMDSEPENQSCFSKWTKTNLRHLKASALTATAS
jgi:hypothetical protein